MTNAILTFQMSARRLVQAFKRCNECAPIACSRHQQHTDNFNVVGGYFGMCLSMFLKWHSSQDCLLQSLNIMGLTVFIKQAI